MSSTPWTTTGRTRGRDTQANPESHDCHDPPAEFIKRHIKAIDEGDFVPWDDVKKKLKL